MRSPSHPEHARLEAIVLGLIMDLRGKSVVVLLLTKCKLAQVVLRQVGMVASNQVWGQLLLHGWLVTHISLVHMVRMLKLEQLSKPEQQLLSFCVPLHSIRMAVHQ